MINFHREVVFAGSFYDTHRDGVSWQKQITNLNRRSQRTAGVVPQIQNDTFDKTFVEDIIAINPSMAAKLISNVVKYYARKLLNTDRKDAGIGTFHIYGLLSGQDSAHGDDSEFHITRLMATDTFVAGVPNMPSTMSDILLSSEFHSNIMPPT